jgi:hypothetical protein
MKKGPNRKITALKGTTFAKDVMKDLKEGFKMGYNNTEACLNANISERIFYMVLAKNPKLKNYFSLLQENVNMIAKTNIAKKVIDGDIENSKWWAERRNKKEFSQRTEQTGAEGKELPTPIIQLNREDVQPNDSDKQDNIAREEN